MTETCPCVNNVPTSGLIKGSLKQDVPKLISVHSSGVMITLALELGGPAWITEVTCCNSNVIHTSRQGNDLAETRFSGALEGVHAHLATKLVCREMKAQTSHPGAVCRIPKRIAPGAPSTLFKPFDAFLDGKIVYVTDAARKTSSMQNVNVTVHKLITLRVSESHWMVLYRFWCAFKQLKHSKDASRKLKTPQQRETTETRWDARQ